MFNRDDYIKALKIHVKHQRHKSLTIKEIQLFEDLLLPYCSLDDVNSQKIHAMKMWLDIHCDYRVLLNSDKTLEDFLDAYQKLYDIAKEKKSTNVTLMGIENRINHIQSELNSRPAANTFSGVTF